jgi:hypothetical protein
MEFEWDEEKNEANIRKHGFDFADGTQLFDVNGQPFLAAADLREDYAEERWEGIGMISGDVVVAVFVEKRPGLIRFISLRKANRREQRAYEKTIENTMGSHSGDERRRN